MGQQRFITQRWINTYVEKLIVLRRVFIKPLDINVNEGNTFQYK